MSYMNRQPKPRPVLPAEHELDPIAESICQNKSILRDHKTVMGNANTNTIIAGGVQVNVAYAAAVASYQLGIPHNHPNLPPFKKFKTLHKDYVHYVCWGAVSEVKWQKDESFKHIPCYSRYVINKQGVIRNAHNGMTLNDNGYSSPTDLVRDGVTNKVYAVYPDVLKQLTLLRLPLTFVDYGFGRQFSHEIGPKKIGEEVAFTWVPLPVISARSNIDGTIHKYSNIYDFTVCAIKDYMERTPIRKDYENCTEKDAIRAGTYSIMKGEHTDPVAFGSAADAPAAASQEAATVSTTGLDNLL